VRRQPTLPSTREALGMEQAACDSLWPTDMVINQLLFSPTTQIMTAIMMWSSYLEGSSALGDFSSSLPSRPHPVGKLKNVMMISIGRALPTSPSKLRFAVQGVLNLFAIRLMRCVSNRKQVSIIRQANSKYEGSERPAYLYIPLQIRIIPWL
jgi:hypothetical protein